MRSYSICGCYNSLFSLLIVFYRQTKTIYIYTYTTEKKKKKKTKRQRKGEGEREKKKITLSYVFFSLFNDNCIEE